MEMVFSYEQTNYYGNNNGKNFTIRRIPRWDGGEDFDDMRIKIIDNYDILHNHSDEHR